MSKQVISKPVPIINCSDVTILGQILGKGAYGEVYTVKYCGSTYAAKEIHKILQEGAQSVAEKRTLKDKFILECSQCCELSHPNIVHVIGIYYKSQDALPVMLMEMMDESLTVYMERLQPNNIVKRKGPILLDVTEGLKYLHDQKPHPIVHRDLSPNNILLVKAAGEMTVAKIGDLGVAKAISPNSSCMQGMGKLTRVPGTVDFMPPEALEDAPEYDTSLDVFSYGAVMLFVATHVWPSPGPPTKFDRDDNSLVACTEVQRRQKYLDKMTDEMEVLKPLVEDCLHNHPNKRPTIFQVSEKLKLLKSEGKLPFMTGGRAPDKRNVSAGSVHNEIYSLDTRFSSDHNNEDEHIVHSNKYSLCMCVFDGHDGLQAVQFVKGYMEQQVLCKQEWDTMTYSGKPDKIEDALAKYIQEIDDNFFKSIDNFICEKQGLQSDSEISKEVNNSQAQQIPRLQELELHISGGCTAVVAVLTSDRLYIANVGDSRAILAYEEGDGSLQVKQLSVDHGVENEQEIERLTAIGLDQEQLKKSGRLGNLENTRSIGDYILKGGYKNMDMISHATDQPGIAVPHVTSMDIDHYTFKYLILMSNGVYKTLEAIGGDIIVNIIDKYVTENGWNETVASNILQEICETQYKLYQKSTTEDVHSPTAVANRKRDDMTLVIYKFDTAV